MEPAMIKFHDLASPSRIKNTSNLRGYPSKGQRSVSIRNGNNKGPKQPSGLHTCSATAFKVIWIWSRPLGPHSTHFMGS